MSYASKPTWTQRGASLLLRVAVCILLLTQLHPARAAETAAQLHAERMLRAFLDAFNTKNTEEIDRFVRTFAPHGPIHTAGMVSFSQHTGGYDLLRITRSEPTAVEFLVKERAGERRALGLLTVSAAAPTTLKFFVLRPVLTDDTLLGYGIDASARQRVVDEVARKLQNFYVFPETAQSIRSALARRLKQGAYDEMTDGMSFASELTKHLQEVGRDKHLLVTFSPARLPQDLNHPGADAAAERLKRVKTTNCGFEKAEILSGNVGYLKLNEFADPAHCGPTASAAMAFLANTDSLVIDLRDNGGGDPAMVALLSTYLFNEPVHLNDLWTRATGKTRQWWTLPHVPGSRLDHQRVYVLTSPRTFSGAEEFSYNLQALKRATIIGERTGGGAHPTRGERIDDRFVVYVPFARAINPITGTNWEGTGVEPDVKVPAQEALETARKIESETKT